MKDDRPAVERKGPDDERGRVIGPTKGRTNNKPHALTDVAGRPLRFFMAAGQVSDYIGTAALLHGLPSA